MDETVYRVIMHALLKGHVFFSPHAAAGKASSSDLAYVQGDSSVPGGRNKKPVLASGASHIVQTSFIQHERWYFSPSLFLLTVSFWSI